MKKLISLITLTVLIAGLFVGCAGESNEPCFHCAETPTRAYKTSEGKTTYVCGECSSECHFCGAPNPKKYTSVIGEVTFACKECLDSMKED
ncbi:MAG: hypothetical protein II996_03520 [Oscillospiraceae bacterium]|nr:hypothetical protein [Oscillospiraceae bacterium]MBQ4544621.1 hypothetical protein [Oscillospiraceae bacterium]MBQ6902342.1 hypothetical protein [Oscillospiraceae bacterium]